MAEEEFEEARDDAVSLALSGDVSPPRRLSRERPHLVQSVVVVVVVVDFVNDVVAFKESEKRRFGLVLLDVDGESDA